MQLQLCSLFNSQAILLLTPDVFRWHCHLQRHRPAPPQRALQPAGVTGSSRSPPICKPRSRRHEATLDREPRTRRHEFSRHVHALDPLWPLRNTEGFLQAPPVSLHQREWRVQAWGLFPQDSFAGPCLVGSPSPKCGTLCSSSKRHAQKGVVPKGKPGARPLRLLFPLPHTPSRRHKAEPSKYQ